MKIENQIIRYVCKDFINGDIHRAAEFICQIQRVTILDFIDSSSIQFCQSVGSRTPSEIIYPAPCDHDKMHDGFTNVPV